ncbi:MAG: hypothetical protein D6758_12010 [Gammaproteobacteria bacterium]|nr:MAG: hypothetical protein D6758_12010 [Gammaproteobacteria bacterium]
MLTVAVAQIEYSLRESEASVHTLSQSFTNILEQLHSAARVKEGNLLAKQLEQLQCETNRCIVSFQFFDRLAQRLHHVKEGLQKLAELIADGDSLSQTSAWDKLQNEIRSRYSMPEERVMFDAILAGASVDEVLEKFIKNFDETVKPKGNNDVELF